MLLGSTVLEVAIGLFFVYLLMSLLCSAVSEYIEAKVNFRAKFLREGIALLLNETDGKGTDLASKLYANGLIRPLYRSSSQLPSYIPSRTFALALWNLATSAVSTGDGATQAGLINDLGKIRSVVATQVPNSELRTAMLTLIDEAGGDMDKARQNIEEWYDAMMDRVAGWYKRRTGHILLVLGFAVAAVVNADTISIARTLAQDGALRTSIVNAAEQRVATPSAPAVPASTAAVPPAATAEDAERQAAAQRDRRATENLREARAAVNALGLPLGWTAWSADREDPRRLPDTVPDWLLKLFGLCLTGFAISQGAPFWFDLLNKVMVIRSTVKPAEKSQAQPSKDRPAPSAKVEQAQSAPGEPPKN
jgi:hypothetical protein